MNANVTMPLYPMAQRECPARARQLIAMQLNQPLAITVDAVLHKLGGYHPDYERRKCNGNELGTLLGDEIGVDMSPGQFLHWHSQHQALDPQKRIYALGQSHGIPNKTTLRVFINMLREGALTIKAKMSSHGEVSSLHLRLLEGRQYDRPSKEYRMVRAYLNERDADKAVRSVDAFGRKMRSKSIGEESMSEILIRLAPGWESDDEFFACVGVSKEAVHRYVTQGVCPQVGTAHAIAEYLGVDVEEVFAACNKTKADLGLDKKFPLREWRERRGMTISELSIRSKVSPISIKKYESGAEPRAKSGIRDALANALGVRVRNIAWGCKGESEIAH